MSVKQNKIRLLPIFIFVAVLTLTIKVNNIFDIYTRQSHHKISITTADALAEEELSSETAELSRVLSGATPETKQISTSPTSTFTQSEIMILQELAERRETLDLRAQAIDKRAIQLKVTEEEINKKLQQLKEYEQKLQKLINAYSEQEKANIDSMVKLYSTMKPKDAARIFNTLDINITVALLKGMKPSASSAILAQMESQKAQAVTAELIGNNL
ncbi:MAG: hypothetical protein E7019_01225 [Alphaproteobacteria bacterium]|nr:hypothetical protein [Alphaproteobacteria bacterium]